MRWLVVLLVLAGCSAPVAAPPPPPMAASVLRPGTDWQSFPADRKPRPIILIDAVNSLPGFTSPQAEEAALAGMFTLAAEPPTIPPSTEVQLSDGPANLPTTGARHALDAMAAKLDALKPAQPLTIERTDLATAEFNTDRGKLTLPAWRFHTQGTTGPFVWPALDQSVFWRLTNVPMDPPTEAKMAKQDGLKLTVTLSAPADLCPGQPPTKYHGFATESPTSVIVGTRGDHTGNCAPAESRLDTYEIALAQPLGGRVLMDGGGTPIPVVR